MSGVNGCYFTTIGENRVTEMSQRFHISLLNDVLSEGFICCKKIRHILDATVNQYLGDTCNSIDYDKITSNVD